MTLKKNQVEQVITERLEPMFALDEGRLEVARVDAERGAVRLRFGGSYEACPGRNLLLDKLVEPTLMDALPEIRKIELE
jgi:Fe-S cluster biogenesis protein NfuA